MPMTAVSDKCLGVLNGRSSALNWLTLVANERLSVLYRESDCRREINCPGGDYWCKHRFCESDRRY